jgi:hypothetical protein
MANTTFSGPVISKNGFIATGPWNDRKQLILQA